MCFPVKAIDGVIAYGYQFGKSSNVIVDSVRHGHNSVSSHGYDILHKTVKSAGTEFAAAQIVLRNDVILLHRSIRYHYHLLSRFKISCRIVDYFTDCFVNQCHRQFFLQHFRRPGSLKIALIRIANGKMCRSNQHRISIYINVGKLRLNASRLYKSIYCIQHYFSPPSSVSAN